VNESARREDTWMRGCRLTRTDGKGVLSVKEFWLEGGLRLEEEPLDEKMIDVIGD
jgi:UDP-3-O-acyl-N-acetylglucosamine deacetylase